MNITGYCNFCRQARMVDLPDTTPQSIREDEANERASMECNCVKGSDWRADRLVIEKCSENIEIMLRETYPEIADILQEAKEIVHSGRVKKITCTTPERTTVTMSKRGGSIDIKYSEKHETIMTADW